MFSSLVAAITYAVRTNNSNLLEDLLPSEFSMGGDELCQMLRNSDSFHQSATVQLALLTGRDVRGFANNGFQTVASPAAMTDHLLPVVSDGVVFTVYANQGLVTHVEPTRQAIVPYTYQGQDEGLVTYRGPVFIGSLAECREWLERYGCP